jgi:hypothetical protein
MTELLAPVRPHEIPAKTRKGLEDLVERITGAAVLHNRGKDMLLLIYLAGMYHGVELSAATQTETGGEDE